MIRNFWRRKTPQMPNNAKYFNNETELDFRLSESASHLLYCRLTHLLYVQQRETSPFDGTPSVLHVVAVVVVRLADDDDVVNLFPLTIFIQSETFKTTMTSLLWRWRFLIAATACGQQHRNSILLRWCCGWRSLMFYGWVAVASIMLQRGTTWLIICQSIAAPGHVLADTPRNRISASES